MKITATAEREMAAVETNYSVRKGGTRLLRNVHDATSELTRYFQCLGVSLHADAASMLIPFVAAVSPDGFWAIDETNLMTVVTRLNDHAIAVGINLTEVEVGHVQIIIGELKRNKLRGGLGDCIFVYNVFKDVAQRKWQLKNKVRGTTSNQYYALPHLILKASCCCIYLLRGGFCQTFAW